MYHLPSVLIDYIFSFDDNSYHKRKFYMVIKELNFWYRWKQTQLFFNSKYNTYKIYYNYQMQIKQIPINAADYILWVAKNYSNNIYVDNIKCKLHKRNL